MGRRVAFRGSRRRTGGAGSSSFIPFSPLVNVTSATLILWVDETSYVLDVGARVGPWNDKSGAANHLTSLGISQGPTILPNAINSTPCPNFSNGGMRLQRVGFTPPALAAEIFIVKKNDLPTPGDHGQWVMGSSAVQDWAPANDGNTYDSFGSTTRKACGPTPSTAAVAHVYGSRAIAGAFTAAFNGVDFFTTAVNVMGWPANIMLGANAVNSPMLGSVGEMLLYNAILSVADRAAVIAFLKAKWGIP